MFPAPLLSRAAAGSSALRWAISLASVVSALVAFGAYAAGTPLAFLGVFVADILIAALATFASELALDPTRAEGNTKPTPEDLAIYSCLHCGVLAMLMMSTPEGVPGLMLLALHQILLLLNARRLPAA